MKFDTTNDYVSCGRLLLTRPLAKLRKDELIEDVLTNS